MGADWGSADSTNVFFLPDLRGLFLRGWNHNRVAPEGHVRSPYTGDPGDLTQTRVVPRPEIATSVGSQGATGDHVGSMQADQVGSHQHTFKYATKGNAFQRLSSEHDQNFWWGDATANGSTDPMAAAENRASNASVAYFIYVGKPAQVIEPTAKEKEDPRTRTGRIECIKNSKGQCRKKSRTKTSLNRNKKEIQQACEQERRAPSAPFASQHHVESATQPSCKMRNQTG